MLEAIIKTKIHLRQGKTKTVKNKLGFIDGQIDITQMRDDNIRRMRKSELETVKENYERKVQTIKEMACWEDIFTTLLINGVISISEE